MPKGIYIRKENRKIEQISKDYLKREYYQNKKSTIEIARELGIAPSTIWKRLIYFKLQPRNRSECQIGVINHRFKGKHHTEEDIQKMKLAKKLFKENFGYINSPETRQKISIKLKGKPFSEEHKRNISKSQKGKTFEDKFGKERALQIKNNMSESVKGEKNPFYGKHHTQETKRINSLSNKGEKNPRFGKHFIFSEEHKRNISKSQKGKHIGNKNNFYGKHHTEETINKLKKNGLKLKILWQNPEFKEETIKKILKGLLKRPTSYEQRISELCFKFNLPFVYKGNGGFLINFKNPDFVNEKDKIVIEVFYSYFKIRDYGNVENYKEFCRKKYEPAGWKVIFLDENDVMADNWEEICLSKINEVLIKI